MRKRITNNLPLWIVQMIIKCSYYRLLIFLFGYQVFSPIISCLEKRMTYNFSFCLSQRRDCPTVKPPTATYILWAPPSQKAFCTHYFSFPRDSTNYFIVDFWFCISLTNYYHIIKYSILNSIIGYFFYVLTGRTEQWSAKQLTGNVFQARHRNSPAFTRRPEKKELPHCSSSFFQAVYFYCQLAAGNVLKSTQPSFVQEVINNGST